MKKPMWLILLSIGTFTAWSRQQSSATTSIAPDSTSRTLVRDAHDWKKQNVPRTGRAPAGVRPFVFYALALCSCIVPLRNAANPHAESRAPSSVTFSRWRAS